MKTQENAKRDWFTVFRTDEGNQWLRDELAKGRLRQGWGAPGLALVGADGEPVGKSDWEAAYRDGTDWEGPSPRRFAILRRMLELNADDIVVMPKMPERNQFTIARATGRYRFELAGGREDFGHVIPVDPDSMRDFAHNECDQARLVSGLFVRANHWPAISFCGSAEHLKAAQALLDQPMSSLESSGELWEAAIDNAFRAAAKSLEKDMAKWNGPTFEKAVRKCFAAQGYDVLKDNSFDGEGGDVDMVVSPPPSRHSVFLPTEIAVQVKWKQGVDEDDEQAVKQIVQWAQRQDSSATKYVISSAKGFTDKAREKAAAYDVMLIGGLQTMCFLLGAPDRYRAEWDDPDQE